MKDRGGYAEARVCGIGGGEGVAKPVADERPVCGQARRGGASGHSVGVGSHGESLRQPLWVLRHRAVEGAQDHLYQASAMGGSIRSQAVFEDIGGELGASWVEPAVPVTLLIAGFNDVGHQVAQMIGSGEQTASAEQPGVAPVRTARCSDEIVPGSFLRHVDQRAARHQFLEAADVE